MNSRYELSDDNEPTEQLSTYASVTSDGIEWMHPVPIISDVVTLEYPVHALPLPIKNAVLEVEKFVQAPIDMVACVALSAVSLVSQAHVDVKRAQGLVGPVGIFSMTIAESGERKSTCDSFFFKEINCYLLEQEIRLMKEQKDYNSMMSLWEAKSAALKKKIGQSVAAGKPTADVESAWRALEEERPKPPRVPRMLYNDITPEALGVGLVNWPSAGIISSEAGVALGSVGMSKESVMRFLSFLNVLWDGGGLRVDRKTSDAVYVHGARFTVGLQVQRSVLASFTSRTGDLSRGIGFMARFLLAWPDSKQGQRPYAEPPDNWPALDVFSCRIREVLEIPVPIQSDGSLTPYMLELSSEAKKVWVDFYNGIEQELGVGRKFHDVRDVASKTADNAVRLAALFHFFDGIGDVIGVDAVKSACKIAYWHLTEALRFLGSAQDQGVMDAQRLEGWLVAYCLEEQTDHVTQREVLRNVSPVHLRKSDALQVPLDKLTEANRVRVVTRGTSKLVFVNPWVLLDAQDAGW